MRGPHCRRRSAPLLLAAVALWAGLAADVAAQGSAATDRAALEALYDATDGPGWTDSTNWKTSAPIGEWFGVSTDAAGRVTRLSLRGNDLTGPIPAELGTLVNLGVLDLGDNALTGSVPAWLGNLTGLRWLHLGRNELTGPIPAELGNLANLESLYLHLNALTGPIPSELGRLVNLEGLSLWDNELTGPVPAWLGNLANLESLVLSWNPLSGTLPQRLTQLARLTELDIRYTGVCAPADAEFQEWLAAINFSGATCNRPPHSVDAIPAQALTESGPALGVSMEAYFSDPDDDRLTYAAASSNAGAVTAFASGDTVWLVPGAAGTATVTVTAQDPDGLSATQAMTVTTAAAAGPQSDREVLEVFYDSTGGASWTKRTNWKTSAPLGEWHGVTTDPAGRVTGLDLNENGLTGLIPPALGDLASLGLLFLGRNELTGPVPAWLGNLVNLWWLDLGGNELTGPVPAALGNLVNLRGLFLGRNELTGPVPAWLGNLVNLWWLDLGGNELTGPVPAALGNLVNLRGLFLGRNELTGPVPAWLGNLVNLGWLRLGGNELTGPVPAALGNLVNLRGLSLWGNELTGPVPAWLGNLVNLESLYLDENDLTGPIPSELGRLVNLGSLHLGGNALTGPIPDELGNLVNLERLGLSYNWGLSGPLPSGLETAPLEALDIFVTRTCAPAAWQEWLATIEFHGPLCETGADVTVDVAVIYTPAAREAAGGGAAAIEAAIDLLIAETNQAYATSGVHQRLALVGRSEVPYTETSGDVDIGRLDDPDDGHLDEAHALRDRTGADLVHLIVDLPDYDVCGIAQLPGAFGITVLHCGGIVVAHELGHNMGLSHDRYADRGNLSPHPAYGYVNQRAFAAEAARSSRWRTIMSYVNQCEDAYTSCPWLLRLAAPVLESAPELQRRPVGHSLRRRIGRDRSGRRGGRPQRHGPRGGAVAGPPGPSAGGGGNPAGPGADPARHAHRGRVAGVRRPRRRPPDLRGVVGGAARGDGAGGGRPRDADGGGCRQGDDPGHGDRPRRPERHAGVHGDGGESFAVHRRPDRGWRDAGQGRPLHRAAGAHRRSAGRGWAGAVPLDGPGPAGGGDAGQARASAGTAGGAGRRVYGSGAGGAALD